jgi:hypothetical protein
MREAMRRASFRVFEPSVRPRLRWLTMSSLVAIVLSLWVLVPAVGSDLERGALGHLAQYIGTYQYEQVVRDPVVKARLAFLLRDKVGRVKADLSVREPIAFEDGWMVLWTSAEHPDGKVIDTYREQLVICVELRDGDVAVGIWSDYPSSNPGGTTQVFTRNLPYDAWPPTLKELAYWGTIKRIYFDPPASGLEWIRR